VSVATFCETGDRFFIFKFLAVVRETRGDNSSFRPFVVGGVDTWLGGGHWLGGFSSSVCRVVSSTWSDFYRWVVMAFARACQLIGKEGVFSFAQVFGMTCFVIEKSLRWRAIDPEDGGSKRGFGIPTRRRFYIQSLFLKSPSYLNREVFRLFGDNLLPATGIWVSGGAFARFMWPFFGGLRVPSKRVGIIFFQFIFFDGHERLWWPACLGGRSLSDVAVRGPCTFMRYSSSLFFLEAGTLLLLRHCLGKACRRFPAISC